jgi:ABC-type sugar transport system permease subunit
MAQLQLGAALRTDNHGRPARQRITTARKEAFTGWHSLRCPWILAFCFSTVGPMIFSLYTSFTRYNSPLPRFGLVSELPGDFSGRAFLHINLEYLLDGSGQNPHCHRCLDQSSPYCCRSIFQVGASSAR